MMVMNIRRFILLLAAPKALLLSAILCTTYAAFGAQEAGQRQSAAPQVILFADKELFGSFEVKQKAPTSYSLQTHGPEIELVSPVLEDGVARLAATDQVSIEVRFADSPAGKRPDMQSLSITVHKGIFSKNITKRFRDYVLASSILVPTVDLSGYSGKYVFRITIADEAGNKSESRFEINVA